MNTRIRQYRIRLFFVVALCLLCVFLFSAFPTVAKAETKTVYSDVLEDLQKDESFKPESYPAKDNGEYSISVIQIAESTNNELFVYTYEPRRGSKELNATSINISTAINDSLKYHNYKLELLNANGVFGKYLVEDFAVLADALRYYDISTIYRTWNEDIDGTITGGNGSEKAFAVACVYSASTVGDTVTYIRRETEIIEIRAEDRFDGFIRYDNGYILHQDACDAWFVAFKSDRKIDDLMEADIHYVSKNSHYKAYFKNFKWTEETTYGESETNELTIKATDEAGNDASGWLGGNRKRNWNRIERASEFRAKEDLTDGAKIALADKQWVLRFTETSFVSSVDPETSEQNVWSTVVSDVTILRLMFETDGVVYNLGVVSDKVSSDNKPDNKLPNGCADFNLRDLWKYILLGIVVIFALVLVIAFFPHIVNLVIWLVKILIKLIIAVLKGLWLIISAPFRGIAALIGKARDKKQ